MYVQWNLLLFILIDDIKNNTMHIWLCVNDCSIQPWAISACSTATKAIRAAKKSEAHTSTKKKRTIRKSPGKPWLNILMSLKLIVTNPVWILLTVAGILEFGIVHALESFLAKLIQFQFRMTAGTGAMVAGWWPRLSHVVLLVWPFTKMDWYTFSNAT